MSRYRVLVDSSVWIEYFKSGGFDKLDRLIVEDLACINELILTELAPALLLKIETELLEGLQAIEMIPLNVDWDIVRGYQLMNLKNGINKVGIPDLIILQQVIDEKITLFSLDKHFKLMQGQLNFDLISE
ncbi:PIN domain-containing protein [Rhodohalobacter mucosus]|uniref:PIN domain nuclease n=1 Tax=Rhodohalobacter mucosus TaxID=2079485 RepID=A0A316TKQ3_9BACT|nr:PIN domain-containing protein [Rhodohalobacter mucosus]PWN05117.1 PIN domain nuclease [Rhodohalobacter mucosus]